MKKIASAALLAFAFLYSVPGYCQKAVFADSSASKISDSTWTFTASFVSPQKGRSGAVNGYYTVTYRDHKLNVYLPYFGEAYGGANVLSGKSPLDFISTNYVLNANRTKKGGGAITINPNDYNEVSSMNLIWYSNGRANLDIIMANRSGISFSGSVSFSK